MEEIKKEKLKIVIEQILKNPEIKEYVKTVDNYANDNSVDLLFLDRDKSKITISFYWENSNWREGHSRKESHV